jgi:hypothetical protein
MKLQLWTLLVTVTLTANCGQQQIGGSVINDDIAVDPTPTPEPEPQLLVASISPNNGLDLGGATVTVTGENFNEDTIIYIGADVCEDVVLKSETELECSTPALTDTYGLMLVANGGEHVVDVKASYDEKESVLEDGFSYTLTPRPSISLISPLKGALLGKTLITVTGTNFTEDIEVSVGASECLEVNVLSETQLTCLSPSGADGAENSISVVNSYGRSATSSQKFAHNDISIKEFSMHASGAVAPPVGFTQSSVLYTADLGFGWEVMPDILQRVSCSSCSPDRRRNSFAHGGGTHTFTVDVPNGEYQVRLYMLDQGYDRDDMEISIEGEVVDIVTVISPTAHIKTYTAIVNDGQLTISVRDISHILRPDDVVDGTWILNTIEILQ